MQIRHQVMKDKKKSDRVEGKESIAPAKKTSLRSGDAPGIKERSSTPPRRRHKLVEYVTTPELKSRWQLHCGGAEAGV